MSTHCGRRVRRATSRVLRSCSQFGNRSFTHLDRETWLEVAAEKARCSGQESSGLINDLHVWFRSFRVKLSRMAPSLHNSARECSASFAPNLPKLALSRAALA